MTARNLLSPAPPCARAALGMRVSIVLLPACFVALGMIAARPAAAQPASWQKRPPARSGDASWRATRRRDAIESERFAQTPAQPQYEEVYGNPTDADNPPEYDGAYQQEGNYAPDGNYDGAAEPGAPPEYDGGDFTGAGPDEFGPYDDEPCCDDPIDDRHCTALSHFDCHGIYARVDYLLWWGKGFGSPPLVTTSVAGTPREEAGILGLATTRVLFPTGKLADTSMNGGRIRLGYWLDPCDTAAIEGSYFAFGKSTTSFNASDANYPILARPFVNIETDAVGNDAELIAYPGLFSGQISVLASSQLQGAEVILRHALCQSCDWRVDCLVGWRYNRLDESLLVSDSRTVLSGQTGLTVGTQLSEFDQFSTRNEFNGAQLGVITELRRCRWWFETRSTLALGNNHSIVTINGQQTAIVPLPGGGEQTTVIPAGLLAQGTNIGTVAANNFAIVPQLGASLGWEISCGLWATVGYNFMYWCNVARPGDQIDTDVNLSQLSEAGLVGLPRPAYTGFRTDYWAQGLNVGLAYRY